MTNIKPIITVVSAPVYKLVGIISELAINNLVKASGELQEAITSNDLKYQAIAIQTVKMLTDNKIKVGQVIDICNGMKSRKAVDYIPPTLAGKILYGVKSTLVETLVSKGMDRKAANNTWSLFGNTMGVRARIIQLMDITGIHKSSYTLDFGTGTGATGVQEISNRKVVLKNVHLLTIAGKKVMIKSWVRSEKNKQVKDCLNNLLTAINAIKVVKPVTKKKVSKKKVSKKKVSKKK
jgi:hypothetical protein